MPRLAPPTSRAQSLDWMQPLRDADRALRNFINPPLSRVRAWQGSMGDAYLSARPVRAEGEAITWEVEVSRGGQRVAAFETVLSGQLSDAQFRPLASGKDSPLKTQILTLLSAPQKRLQNLGVTVDVRDARGGESLQATIMAMQQYRGGKWQTQGYAVGEVRSYSLTPIYAGQPREPLGYFRRSEGRGEAIRAANGKPAHSLEEAKQLVQARLSNGRLMSVSVLGAQKADQVRRQLQADIKPAATGGAAQLVAWQVPVALDKPLEKMNPTERIGYTVRVAKQYLPADVGARLQALMTPQTLATLAAYAGSHALGVGFIGDGLGLAHMLAGTRDGLRQLDNYLRTTLRAKHPMELANAGRELSEIMAPLLIEGGVALTARGIGRAARRHPPSTTALALRPASSIAAQFPAVGSVQVQLARQPEKALQVLKGLVEGGQKVTAADVHYAQQLNLAALQNLHGRIPASAKPYLRELIPWAESLATQLRGTKAPAASKTALPRVRPTEVVATRATRPALPLSTTATNGGFAAKNTVVEFPRTAPPPIFVSSDTPLPNSEVTNPYKVLRGNKVPLTLRSDQIALANAVNLRAQLGNRESNPELLGETPSSVVERKNPDEAVKINFGYTSSLSSQEKQQLSALLSDGSVIQATLAKINSPRPIHDLRSVDVNLHSEIGLNRLVYKVTCHFQNHSEPSVFIVKVARKSDVDALNQALLTKLIDEKLGRDFGIITRLNDGRIVVTGPFIQGKMLSELSTSGHAHKYQQAAVAESVDIWKKLGGFFILDPHTNQFLVRHSGEHISCDFSR